MDEKKKEKFQKKVDKIFNQIEEKGWKPKVGFKLAELYFDMGELDKAEEHYFKYLDHTKSQEGPM